MRRSRRSPFILLSLLLIGLLGWWLGKDFQRTFRADPPAIAPRETAVRGVAETDLSAPAGGGESRGGRRRRAPVELYSSRNENEVILRLPTQETYAALLTDIGRGGVTLVERLDRLLALRVAFDDWADIEELLADKRVAPSTTLPTLPERSDPGAGIEPGMVAIGEKLPQALGAATDRSAWGKGVRIAVLDTGIVAHPALAPPLRSIATVAYPADAGSIHGHGTAVASIIAGRSADAPGIAPAADLISIRVSDDEGVTDPFALAAGILAAMDAGSHLINLSLGTYQSSSLAEDAVRLAQESGVLIIAAAGNDGLDDTAYPAGYDGVVSVGAVDARGIHLRFSNHGDHLYFTAPGYAVNAAWPGGRVVRFSGTSASAPVVTGAIAALMSPAGTIVMNAEQALELLTAHADDAGLPGPDSQYGFGIVNIGRVINRGKPGILDAAITDQRIVAAAAGGYEIQVTIQNRGTATLINTLVEITGLGGTRWVNATSIPPGAIHTVSTPINLSAWPAGQPLTVSSTLKLSGNTPDITPENNRRSDTFYPGGYD